MSGGQHNNRADVLAGLVSAWLMGGRFHVARSTSHDLGRMRRVGRVGRLGEAKVPPVPVVGPREAYLGEEGENVPLLCHNVFCYPVIVAPPTRAIGW